MLETINNHNISEQEEWRDGIEKVETSEELQCRIF